MSKRFRKSKSPDFLERKKTDQAMVEYLTRLRIMNPAADLSSDKARDGRFVRLAHANEEFPAPVLTKGKSVSNPSNRSPLPLGRLLSSAGSVLLPRLLDVLTARLRGLGRASLPPAKISSPKRNMRPTRGISRRKKPRKSP
jgi:hypothetical protein